MDWMNHASPDWRRNGSSPVRANHRTYIRTPNGNRWSWSELRRPETKKPEENRQNGDETDNAAAASAQAGRCNWIPCRPGQFEHDMGVARCDRVSAHSERSANTKRHDR